MIFDTLKNCELYYTVNAKFKNAFDFIKQAIKDDLPVGKYEINGKELYASVSEYNTKAAEDAKFEGHRNYIDIQYIVYGKESMGVVNIEKAVIKTDYNAEKDVEFYESSDEASKCVVSAGEYGIFMPEDIHQPNVAFNGISSPVKKIVVKVKI